ncbi:MAG: hypothetical protein IJX81_05675 [Clostridia bacterium]|nr:hypothetical protein [Clostridia bacterium]
MEMKKENGYESELGTERGVVEKPEGGENGGSTALGKFKDVNALLQAYSALEAEFTRRSQRLKAYEKALENEEKRKAMAAMEADVETDAVAEDVTDAGNTPRDGADTLSSPEQSEEKTPESAEVCPLRQEENETEATPGETGPIAAGKPVREVAKAIADEELFSAVMANESVRLKIVGEYLGSLKKSGVTLAKGGTGTLGVLPKRPKNISDAGRMALGLFQDANFKG